MADDPFEKLHLAFMQEVLPVSLAMLDRAKQGGPSKVVEVFTSSNEPFQDLRSEGDASAQKLRQQLDEIRPGLGNPIMPVNVEVDNLEVSNEDLLEKDSLVQVLERIQINLEALEKCLEDDSNSVN